MSPPKRSGENEPRGPSRSPKSDAPAGGAVRAAVASALARLQQHESAARAGDDEAVHQMRVATRRLRSDLRTFRPLVEESWAKPLRTELKWLADHLGAVRDLDVLIVRLQEEATGATPKQQAALRPIWEDLEARRAAARATLLDALDSPRFPALQDALAEGARVPALTPEALEPCRKVLPRLVKRAWKPLARAGRQLSQDAPDEAFHAARIRAKRARYAAEAVAPSLGKKTAARAVQFARRVADIQEILGIHQDAVIAREAIRQAADDRQDLRGLKGAVTGIERKQERAARAARRAFRKAWNRLDRKKLQTWMD